MKYGKSERLAFSCLNLAFLSGEPDKNEHEFNGSNSVGLGCLFVEPIDPNGLVWRCGFFRHFLERGFWLI